MKRTVSRVATLRLGLSQAAGTGARVNDSWLPDDESILHKLPNILPCRHVPTEHGHDRVMILHSCRVRMRRLVKNTNSLYLSEGPITGKRAHRTTSVAVQHPRWGRLVTTGQGCVRTEYVLGMANFA